MSQPEYLKRTPPLVKPVQRQAQPAAATTARPIKRDRLSWQQFAADPERYARMKYRACGQSGLKLPLISLGAWETFGGYVGAELARACIFRAFNLGITHFDLANIYGNPPGRAEIIVGRALREMPREELIIATKAGLPMSPGPYGQGASRKALFASLENSLKRLGLDYVDIFYSHRPDPTTPLEETLRALDQIVRDGKALYIGLSNYSPEQLETAMRLVRELHLTPPIAHQVGYSMLRREMETQSLPTARRLGLGVLAFSPLGQGLLSRKYLTGIPGGSRGERIWSPAQRNRLTPAMQEVLRQLNELAQSRHQTLPQMAIAWTLRRPEVCTALIGVSEIDQLEENVKAMEGAAFTEEELARIDALVGVASAAA